MGEWLMDTNWDRRVVWFSWGSLDKQPFRCHIRLVDVAAVQDAFVELESRAHGGHNCDI